MRVFLDLLPGHDPADRAAAVEAGAEIVRERDGSWIEVFEPSDLLDLPADAGLWLVGAEAGGPVGRVGALTLIRAAVASGRPWVACGLGRRAAAATVALGAVGVVVEVGAWLTEGSPIHPKQREALLRARSGRDTEVIDLERGLRAPATAARAAWWSHPESRIPAPQSVGSGWRAPTAAALTALVRRDVQAHLHTIDAHQPLRPGQDHLGTPYPLIQGPMANIAEGSGLAVAVAEAGALPFAALGALTPDAAAAVLEDFATALPDRPWGVGVIGFEMMPHRDAHLDAIVALGARGPAAVILAGGSPALATSLQDRGLHPWLHTPSAALLARAADRGVRTVVLEGRDAGGHVGALTSLGLWEEGLAAAEGRSLTVVLAGGIADPTTAALAAAMAAPACATGVAVALQAGTAFLFTHEIAESGQLAPAAQQAGLATHQTVLVGTTVNLALRCAPNRFTDEAIAQERAWLAEGLPLAERRARVEAHNLGRTRIAAKGIERSPDWPERGPRYRAVPTQRQRIEGAFSLGEGAILTDRLMSVAEVVTALTAAASALLAHPQRIGPGALRWPEPAQVDGGPRTERIPTAAGVQLGGRARAEGDDGAIAVVGLGCVLPGAPDVDQFWANLLHGVDAIGPVPDERWPAHRYFHPHAGSAGPALSASRLAGVVHDLAFDPLRYRIPPAALPTVDPAQRMALVAADQAVTDAGWVRPDFDRSRAAVILGNSMGGEHAKSLALRVRFREVLAALEAEGALDALPPEARDRWFERVEGRLDESLPPVAVDSMTGLLANVIAGRVASWLDWMGGNLTVDAACAASLASVAVAVDWLRSGRCDAVLAGGVDADLSPETFVGFTRTHALSATGSTPFSTAADGFVMGEGAAVLALMRLSDAQARNQPVYAVIRGVGQSSDGRGRGLTAPRPTGQRLAIQRAWADAGVPVERAALIEAHGTGTVVGDATEVGVLGDWLGDGANPVWLGSVKSMIGHLKGGAGAAGLLKTTLSLATGVALPTLHAGPLQPALHRGRLQLPRRPTALPDGPAAGVSAFGFGGTNFHVVLEPGPVPHDRAAGWRTQALPLLVDGPDARWEPEAPASPLVLCFGAPDRAALQQAVHHDQPAFVAATAAASHRCVVVCEPSARAATLERVARWLLTAEARDQLGGTAYCGQGPACAPVALFPGQGSQRPGLTHALSLLPAGAQALARWPVPAVLDDQPLTLHQTLVPLALGWAAVLRDAGIGLAAGLGHSLGELSALGALERITPAAALELAQVRGQALQDCEPGAMLAVEATLATAELLAAAHGVWVAAHNAENSVVLAGSAAALEAVAHEIEGSGVRHRRLAVQRAYHSPSVGSAATALAEVTATIPVSPGLTVYSCATGSPSSHPLQSLVEGIGQPVRFATAASHLVQRGHTLFVELGPGATLSRLVQSLPGVRAIPLDPTPADRGLGLVRAAAALLAEGHPGLLGQVPASHRMLAIPAPSTAPDRRPQHGGGPELIETPSPPVQRHDQPAPERVEPVDADPIRAAVIEAVCEVSGYPADFLTGDAELEAELGVDSIRKLEILGRLEDGLGFRVAESEYRFLERADIDGLTVFVRERVGQAGASVTAPAPAAQAGATLWTWGLGEPALCLPREQEAHASGLTRSTDVWTYVVSREPGSLPDRIRACLTELGAGLTAPEVTLPDRFEVVTPLDEPVGRAVAAFVRSAGRELGFEVVVALLDGGGAAQARAALGPLTDGTVVVRPSATYPRVLQPLLPRAPAAHRPVLWCTGGLAGILGSVLEALVDCQPTVVLLGRTSPDDESPRGAAHRAVRTHLAERGLAVRWIRCDLTVASEVPAAVRAALAASGPPDLVLHAAGRTADGPVGAAPETRDAVLGPKVDGLARLQQALPDARWLLFSSVAATRGNPGQTGYAAANGALLGWPIRGTAVALTAWTERGMAADPALQRLLSRRGLVPVSPREGSRAMASLVHAALADQLPREVVLLGQGSAASLPWPLGAWCVHTPDRARFTLPLDPTDPALDHHRMAGRPLVPGALWARALLVAADVLEPDCPWSLTDFRIEAPTFVDQSRHDLTLSLSRASGHLDALILAGDAPIARGRLVVAHPIHTPSTPDPIATVRLQPAPYQELAGPLFHGPHWQVLQGIKLGPDTARALVRLDHTDPVAAGIEAAHQLLSLWSGAHAGHLGLPVGADSWTVLGPVTTDCAHLHLTVEACDDGVLGRVVLTADTPAAHTPFLVGEGVRLKHARAWPEPVDA